MNEKSKLIIFSLIIFIFLTVSCGVKAPPKPPKSLKKVEKISDKHKKNIFFQNK